MNYQFLESWNADSEVHFSHCWQVFWALSYREVEFFWGGVEVCLLSEFFLCSCLQKAKPVTLFGYIYSAEEKIITLRHVDENTCATLVLSLLLVRVYYKSAVFQMSDGHFRPMELLNMQFKRRFLKKYHKNHLSCVWAKDWINISLKL